MKQTDVSSLELSLHKPLLFPMLGDEAHKPVWGQSHGRRQTVNMDLSKRYARRLHRLCCSFGEVQQDLLLSCLTVGQAYCLLEILK